MVTNVRKPSLIGQLYNCLKDLTEANTQLSYKYIQIGTHKLLNGLSILALHILKTVSGVHTALHGHKYGMYYNT